MLLTRKVLLGCCVACVALVVVSASMTENFLTVPLFEVGSLWIQAMRNLASKITSMIFQKPDFMNPLTYILLGVASYLLWQLYRLFFVPINRIRLLGDVGYIPEGRCSMKETANRVRKLRQVGDVPPVYPNGWFSAMESRDLKKEESKTISILGLTLAVFRGTDGTAYILDAYCPHMGANLGVGGQVKGNCIECPFHGWGFRGEDGKCVDIPYLPKDQKITSLASTKSYTVLERNGFIYLWYHAEGIEPYWEPPEIEEISSGAWVYRGRSEHIVNCHIEDIPENGADVAHLSQVHGPIMTSGIDLRYTYSKIWSFAKHHWDGAWSASTEEGEKHIGTLNLKHTMSLFGIHVPILDMNVQAKQMGPGTVYLMFSGPTGCGVFLHHVTPLEPLTQKMVHAIYFSRYCPLIIPKFYLLAESLMVERDIMIWNNKKYEGKPVFVKSKEDALVSKHRRWYSQFYSENSPRLTFKKDSLEW